MGFCLGWVSLFGSIQVPDSSSVSIAEISTAFYFWRSWLAHLWCPLFFEITCLLSLIWYACFILSLSELPLRQGITLASWTDRSWTPCLDRVCFLTFFIDFSCSNDWSDQGDCRTHQAWLYFHRYLFQLSDLILILEVLSNSYLSYLRWATVSVPVIYLRRRRRRDKILALDLFQPKTSTFSTHALIWVYFKTVHYFYQPIFNLFPNLKNAWRNLVIELCRALFFSKTKYSYLLNLRTVL